MTPTQACDKLIPMAVSHAEKAKPGTHAYTCLREAERLYRNNEWNDRLTAAYRCLYAIEATVGTGHPDHAAARRILLAMEETESAL